MENTTLLLVGTMVACTTGALMVILKESGQYVSNPKPNTNPITSVQEAVIEYQDGLKNIPNPWVFPIEQSYIKKIENASNSLTTYSQVTAMPFLNPPQQSLMYKGLKPWSGPPESNFCFDFETTNLGWYFMYGSTISYRFTLMIFHVGLNGKNPERALFSIVGGCDVGDGWKPIPQNGAPAFYNCDKEQNVSFKYNANGIIANFDRSAKSNQMSGSFSYSYNSKPVNLSFTLTPKQKAVYNGPDGGCVPLCFGGLGTLYWSYTNPTCTITVGKTTQGPGTSGTKDAGLGWFDHQNLSGGIPHGTVNQILYAFGMGGKVPSPVSWLWLTLQLKDKQYAGSITGIEDKLPLKEGMEFPIELIKYTKDGVEYNIKGSVKIMKTSSVFVKSVKYTMVFPTTYEFTIPNEDKLTLQSDAKKDKPDIVVMHFGGLNWEGPGSVYDSNNKWIGKGFLEGNNLLPSKIFKEIILQTAFPDTIANASGQTTLSDINIDMFEQKPLSSIGKIAGITLIILFLILATCTVVSLIKIF